MIPRFINKLISGLDPHVLEEAEVCHCIHDDDAISITLGEGKFEEASMRNNAPSMLYELDCIISHAQPFQSMQSCSKH